MTRSQVAADATVFALALVNIALYVWVGHHWYNLAAGLFTLIIGAGIIRVHRETNRIRREIGRLQQQIELHEHLRRWWRFP